MTQITTFKVERQAIDWLNILKGHLEYDSVKKLKLNEAFMSVMAIADLLFLKGQSLKDIINETEIQELMERRISRFWGEESEDKPSIIITDTGNIVIKEKKSKPNKSLLDMT